MEETQVKNMETEVIKPAVSVRKLISAYENIASNPELPFFRPRARSLGTLLSNDVHVAINNFDTLDDIEEVLSNLEKELNNYQVYNKATHVAFQEELFNILTSVINIDNDDPNRANLLILKTKGLVAVLNNKLPSNNVAETRYKTYSNQVSNSNKSKSSQVSDSSKNIQKKNADEISKILQNKNERKVLSVNEEFTEIDGIISSVSVKKLKEKFQSFQDNTDKQTKIKRTQSHYIREKPQRIATIIPKPTATTVKIKKSEIVKAEVPKIEEPIISKEEVKVTAEPVPTNSKIQVSVSSLRSIFEVKTKEGSAGLPVILKNERPPITRFNYKKNFNDEPELATLTATETKTAQPGTSRLLAILTRENENLIKYELSANQDEKKPSDFTDFESNENFSEDETFDQLENEESFTEVEDVNKEFPRNETKINKLHPFEDYQDSAEEDDGYVEQQEEHHNGFKFELNINKEDDSGEIIPVPNKYDLYDAEFDKMASLEYVEEDEQGSLFDEDSLSDKSVKSAESVKLINVVNYSDENVDQSESIDGPLETINRNNKNLGNHLQSVGKVSVGVNGTDLDLSSGDSFQTAQSVTLEGNLNSAEYDA